jgi:sulfate transporter 4
MLSCPSVAGVECIGKHHANVCHMQGTILHLLLFATGLAVMLVLLFITPVFERVPYNAMGAIVLSSVLGLLEISEAIFLFKANFLDFLVWMSAFLGTIFLGVEIGLLIAIGLAVVLVVYQSAFPHTAVLGNLPGTGVGLCVLVLLCSPHR